MKPRLNICRRCPRLKHQAEFQDEAKDEIILYQLICRYGAEHDHGITMAWEWRNPHRFDFNEHFRIPMDCHFALEQVIEKGRRYDNGNSFEEKKNEAEV